MNIQGTDGGSLTVGLPDMSFEDTRRQMYHIGALAGWNSPRGHRYSKLIEQTHHYRTASGEQRANLAKLIQKTMDELKAA